VLSRGTYKIDTKGAGHLNHIFSQVRSFVDVVLDEFVTLHPTTSFLNVSEAGLVETSKIHVVAPVRWFSFTTPVRIDPVFSHTFVLLVASAMMSPVKVLRY